MDFKQLQSYIAVVKYKSFTIAAEKLGISQPTISTHIRILESELDSQLVARTSKNFEITPRGWEMYECAQSILKLRDDMVDRWNGKESKVIRLVHPRSHRRISCRRSCPAMKDSTEMSAL